MSKEIQLYSKDNKYQCSVELADSLDNNGCPDHSVLVLTEDRKGLGYVIVMARDGLLETEKDKRITELEQDLEFTTKTANELIEIKHKLEQELAELKEKAIVPRFKIGQEVWWIDTRGNIYNKQNYKIDSYLIDSIVVTDNKFRYYGEDGCWLGEEDLFATEQEAQAKLKEIQGNE